MKLNSDIREQWELWNSAECGFTHTPTITRKGTSTYDIYVSEVKYLRTTYNNYHTSLHAAKHHIRKNHSVKGRTPRFKWVRVK